MTRRKGRKKKLQIKKTKTRKTIKKRVKKRKKVNLLLKLIWKIKNSQIKGKRNLWKGYKKDK